MKWLQWSEGDLRNGLGGVEVHARSLARELGRMGVEVLLSSDRADLKNPKWDVIHTHGADFARGHRNAVSVHTLHGSTLERMSACREWTWPRGYLAWGREVLGMMHSDVTLAVHPELSLFRHSKNFSKVSAVCGNGWDSKETSVEELPSQLVQEIRQKNRPFWLFVGRGDDCVKGADRLNLFLESGEELLLVAAPGAGFESQNKVIRTGRLSPSQVSLLMSEALGLLVTSYYEGNPLVILEALAQGTPVVSTSVGGIQALPPELLGLVSIPSMRDKSQLITHLRTAVRVVEAMDITDTGRMHRGQKNRLLLPTWKMVAEVALHSVEKAMRWKRR